MYCFHTLDCLDFLFIVEIYAGILVRVCVCVCVWVCEILTLVTRMNYEIDMVSKCFVS